MPLDLFSCSEASDTNIGISANFVQFVKNPTKLAILTPEALLSETKKEFCYSRGEASDANIANFV